MKSLIFYLLLIVIVVSCKKSYYELEGGFAIIYSDVTNNFALCYKSEGLIDNVTHYYEDDLNIILKLSTYEYVLIDKKRVINNYGKNYAEMKKGVRTYGNIENVKIELGFSVEIKFKKI